MGRLVKVEKNNVRHCGMFPPYFNTCTYPNKSDVLNDVVIVDDPFQD